uniref:Uncharacterized protein n=1 Tax=Arundo donax TaxID=35708 RepID=A0A0A9BU83_ARUDO
MARVYYTRNTFLWFGLCCFVSSIFGSIPKHSYIQSGVCTMQQRVHKKLHGTHAKLLKQHWLK